MRITKKQVQELVKLREKIVALLPRENHGRYPHVLRKDLCCLGGVGPDRDREDQDRKRAVAIYVDSWIAPRIDELIREIEFQNVADVPTRAFIRAAEMWLSGGWWGEDPTLTDDERAKLRSTVMRMYDGSETAGDGDTPTTWLERLRDHHP